MQTTTERPARGAGATFRRSTKGVHSTDPLKGGQTVRTLQNGVLKNEQALKGAYRASTLFTPPGRRGQKFIPQGVPFDDLSPGQQDAVRSLRKLREQMAAEIERMIDFLDSTDGYSAIEVEEDEADPTDAALRRVAPASAGTLEDDEPSLGSVGALSPGNPYFDQSNWAVSGKDDRESDGADDPNGEEVNEDGDGNPDDEPSLGWTNQMAQGQEAWGSCDDKEEGPGPDIAAARKRGRSDNPGISVNRLYSGTLQIAGLTAQQKQALGTEWVRR